MSAVDRSRQHSPVSPRHRLISLQTKRGLSLLSPTLVIMVLALALPLFILVVISFWVQDGIDMVPDFSLQNYRLFFERQIYPIILGRSIENSAMVAVLSILFAYPAAYYIAFKVKRQKITWLILITLPFWSSYLLRVFAWKIILGYNGVINSGLIELGLISQPLDFLLHNRGAVVLTLAHAWAAFAILPIYVSLEKIDRALLEAASDLGEGAVGRFLRVTLPLSLPGVVGAALLVFIPTVGDYVTPNLVGGNSGIMIGNLVETQFGRANNWPLGAAMSLISMAAISVAVSAFVVFIHQVKRQVLV